ncbi:molybdopterin biosynthesis protein [Komagataeibacter nataicola]|uniref:Molybdopterin biosynthesis protein n=1 Tax=Komagataeibacter nataicola TaxID=265960 RepID=A0A9N7H1S9_9PROT|nr:nucleotidyltransferase family protein [Komagataeibacter nataicola]AQU88022.1 molybdopterin biosynthesis protein [Komagataeibacter nataicola]PYD65931.1 molybdopterin biosynthesis protein [Komagataeibacter nataicola]WEQ55082.1 nucleotidyltransferase family protein [Komagataeibacter nataicola]GBR18296.1 translation initiation inhibitor YjgF [Komagataeibacter nataicola NRIC 0616]
MTAVPGRIAAIVLAGGTSSRTAPAHKLLAPDATGLPMIARTLRAVTASRADPVFIVLGHRAAEIRQAALRGLPPNRRPRFITAPDHAHGLSRTLAAGVRAAMDDPTITGALICLGDMPLIGPLLLDTMMASFGAHPGCPGVLAMHEGRRGNPVLWGRAVFPALLAGRGDSGARHLLAQHAPAMPRVAAGAEIAADFDTPERLAEFSRLFAGS